MACLSQALYPPSKPLPVSLCSKAHHAAIRESFRPPNPLDLPWAATADRRSKKLKIICDRVSLSTLKGIKVLKESLAMFESADWVCQNTVAVEDVAMGVAYLALRL